MDTHKNNHRKLKLIMTLKTRVEKENFKARHAERFAFRQTSERVKERALRAAAIYQGRLEKLRAVTTVDFLILTNE